MYLLHDSELSDQGAVCLQAHQILRRPETKSKHTEVPFQIHLRNGRAVCCMHALTLFFCFVTTFYATLLQQSFHTFCMPCYYFFYSAYCFFGFDEMF